MQKISIIKHIVLPYIILATTQSYAEFDFGECSGSGTFEQEIVHYNGDYEKTTTVGTIPAGIEGLKIELLSDKDVDIRLYGANQDKVVHWPEGIHHYSQEKTLAYKGTDITYSGYNGLNGKRGHEFIHVLSKTPTQMVMKAFGYRAGYATVNYSWTGKTGCTVAPSGEGSFTQKILNKETTLVGTIPPNIDDVYITLKSDKDIDIQLYNAEGTAIVSWKPKGILSGSQKATTNYHGLTIEWSGYNGVGGKKGHEYIKITGKTPEMLVMKVYGYQAGQAAVNYTWGVAPENNDISTPYAVANQGTEDRGFNYYKDPNNVLDNDITTFNMTKNNAKENWLQVKLIASASLSRISVVGRQSNSLRFLGAKVYLLDKEYHTGDVLDESKKVGTLTSSYDVQNLTFPTPKKGQFVVIKAKDDNYLHLSEISLYGEIDKTAKALVEEDLAGKYGIATQGMKNENYQYYQPADNVLDNNPKTYNHTNNSQTQNWVQVALPHQSRLNKVVIQTGLSSHAYRLKDAKVYLLDHPYNTGDVLDPKDQIATMINSLEEQVFTFDHAKHGQYIVVKAEANNYLHIAKIKAYGITEPAVYKSNTLDLAQSYGYATQGTTDTNYGYYKTPNNVLDGNADTYNHTRNSETENWVQVALAGKSKLNKIVVQTGLLAHAYRLKNAKVYLLDKPYHTGDTLDDKKIVGTMVDSAKEQVFNFDTPKLGQYIVVRTEAGQYLHLAKIKAYGVIDPVVVQEKDLASTYGVASQGTADEKYGYYQTPDNVLDNNPVTYNHTRNSPIENWVQVSLLEKARLNKVVVQTGLLAHAYRLKGAKVYLLNKPYQSGDVLDSSKVIATMIDSPKEQVFNLATPKEGQYIVIKGATGTFLHIAKIRAYGVMNPAVEKMADKDLASAYGIATQGTTDSGYGYYQAPNNVLDNNPATYNHTRNTEKENWVQVSLRGKTRLNKLVVQTGLRAHAYRLKGAKIYLLSKPYHNGDILDPKKSIGTMIDSLEEQVFNFEQLKAGQYIVIKGVSSEFLHISNIKAYGIIDPIVHQMETTDLAHAYGLASQGTKDSNYIYYKTPNNVLDHNPATYNHTSDNSTQNWVQVALAGKARLNKVLVQIGFPTFSDRLKDAKVYLLEKAYQSGDVLDEKNRIGTLINSLEEQVFNIPNPKAGQYILVQATAGKFLHIAQIKAYGIIAPQAETSASNDLVQMYATARQGTTDENYVYYEDPKNVLDNNTETHNQTSNNERNNWVEVALLEPARVHKVKVLTGLRYFGYRLDGAKVYLRDTPYNNGDVLDEKDVIGTMINSNHDQTFTLPNVRLGQYVVIKASGSNFLHIATVKIYGIINEAPIFEAHTSHYLLAHTEKTGKEIMRLNAHDYQGDQISYRILNSTLFTVDSKGVVRLKGKPAEDANYKLQIEVTDGLHTTRTQIEVQVTKALGVEDALRNGRTDKVTKEQLLYAAIQAAGSNSKYAATKRLLNHIYKKDLTLDWSHCTDLYDSTIKGENQPKCTNVPGIKAEFIDGAKAARSILYYLDQSKNKLFDLSDYRFEKLLVLVGDKIRGEIVLPIDKVIDGTQTFIETFLADSTMYNYRSFAPKQNSLGSFSRSDFSHITPVNRTLTQKSQTYFKSTGLYALPGQTVTIKRNDNSSVRIGVFVNSVREGSTHEYQANSYNRPKYLQSPHYDIKSGETIAFTSAYGGPIQLAYSKNGQDVSLSFSNVGEHAYWASTADDASFSAKLKANEFDWAEISTAGFEVHSKLDKMIVSTEDERWGGNAAGMAAAVVKYTSNYPHVLSGFQGKGIDVIPEIHDWAADNGLEISTIDFMKHMNADQAACGYGCSGNPYDAYWAFDPIAHGDIHELGHSLQAKQFEGFPNHAGTNPYAMYTKAKYYENTSKLDGDCQSVKFKDFYNLVQAGTKSGNVANYMKEKVWSTGELDNRYAFLVNMYMHAQKQGKLQNGWHVLARVHILDRVSYHAIRNNKWDAKKSGLGFGSYSKSEYQAMRRNDWMVIAYSYAAQLDFTDYFDMVGIPYGQKARSQIKSFGFDKAPKSLFVSTDKGWCTTDDYGTQFDRPTVPVDGTTAYPF